MREVISIHIGQAGVQTGNACWELYCLEHGIQPDGIMPSSLVAANDSRLAFFSEHGCGRHVPRSIFVDLEPTVIDEVRVGPYRQLFHPEQLLTGKEDSGGNYARGHNTKLLPILENRIRRLADNCMGLEGFMIFHAVGGGTGSGLGALLMERLSVDYGKKAKLSMSVYPSSQGSTSCVEPYNAVLSTRGLLEHTDISVVLDNEAVVNMCKRARAKKPTNHFNLNNIISKVVSSVTASNRFDSSTTSMFCMNLPYPRIHMFAASHCAPRDMSVMDITDSVIESHCCLAQCNPRLGKNMSWSLLYTGDVAAKDANLAVMAAKRRVPMVDWAPGGASCRLYNEIRPEGAQRAVTMIANTTAIAEVFCRVAHKFDRMYATRAFVHHYVGEGLEEGELTEARGDLRELQNDYKELEMS